MSGKRVLFIAGMHRSGTSLTAQWLHQNGLFIGDALLSGYSDNKYGHFEDQDFLDITVNQLRVANLHDSGLFLKGRSNFTFDKARTDDILSLISRRNREHATWGWKEPRSTLYLAHLKKLIPDLQVLALYRHPAMVIQSLYKRLKRNKWYYTRNPFKKVRWYFEINMNANRWIKEFEETYVTYNDKILEFQKEFPEDILMVDSETMIKKERSVASWLKKRIEVPLHKKISDVFDADIYSRKPTLVDNSKIPNALKVYNLLKN